MGDAWWKIILVFLISILSFAQIDSETRRGKFDPEELDLVKQAELGYTPNIELSELDGLDSTWISDYFGDLINAYNSGYIPEPPDSVTALQWLQQINKSEDFDVEYITNGDIQKNITYFGSKKGRRFLVRSLKRAIFYSPITLEVIARSNMPEEFVFLPIIESGYRPKARSRAGARGIWQFMRATGKKYGLKIIRYRLDERMDPQRSAEAAMMYLKDLYDSLGRWDLAIAAYNAGERRVMNAIEQYRLEHPEDTLITFWDIKDKLPRETRKYVPRFYALLRIMRDPELYGFGEVFDTLYCEQMQYETIAISGPADLRKIARMTNLSVRTIRKMNPHILSNRIPSKAENIVLRMPPGSVEALLSIPSPRRG